MNNKQIVIKVTNDKIYFNREYGVPICQTNIPIEHLLFKSYLEIFWLVVMKKFNKENNCLTVSIKNYDIKNNSYKTIFGEQIPKKQIKELLFEKLDWKKMEPLLSAYQKSKLIKVLDNLDFNPDESRPNHTYFDNITAVNNEKTLASLEEDDSQKKPIKKVIKEDFWLDFNKINFKLGYVTFQKYVDSLRKNIDFRIENDNLLEEFDSIKNWFAKKLKIKRVKISVEINLVEGEISTITAKSKDLDRINPELIESIKYQRTIGITKEPKITTLDKALFTADDIFSQFNSEETDGNIFNQNEEDILNLLINNNKIRNRKQLAFLAGAKQTKDHKLRYTLKPHFGFLFLVEGETNNHFIWELLNSHATYIWSFDKVENNIKMQYKRIESIINTIRTQGRQNYKSAYINNHQDNDLVFRIIKHDSIKSAIVDDFPKWKSNLNEQLI